MCQSLPRGVEADVKLLKAANKVWPEEEEKKKTHIVEDQGKIEEIQISCSEQE